MIKRLLAVLRGWQWWAIALLVIGGGWALNELSLGYVWRAVGAAGKFSLGAVLGYWFSRNLVFQGGRIPPFRPVDYLEWANRAELKVATDPWVWHRLIRAICVIGAGIGVTFGTA